MKKLLLIVILPFYFMMIPMKRNVILFFLCVFVLFSCKKSSHTECEGKLLTVDLEETVEPFERIFSKAEILPLETMDSSLIVWMNKIVPVEDKLYIHDDWANKLHVFDESGKYKCRISRYGQGPDEYLNMFDCIVDALNDDIYMLSVYGSIKRYSLDGTYKEDIILPDRPHYYSISLLEDKYWATWSCLAQNEGSILVLDRDSLNVMGSYWHDDRIFNHQEQAPFHQYEGRTYFGTALRQQVYEVSVTGLRAAYLWDFGKYNIKESSLEYYLNIENSNKRNDKIIDDYGSDFLPFILDLQRQNDKYYYVGLRRDSGMRPPMTHVFYNKVTHKSLVFDYLGDGCRMNAPLYFGEDYLLTDVLYEDRERLQKVLPESEYLKLKQMQEDDNPCLLKLYFK